MAQPKKRLPEAHMRFYAAEVLLALQYLHLLGFVYRCACSLVTVTLGHNPHAFACFSMLQATHCSGCCSQTLIRHRTVGLDRVMNVANGQEFLLMRSICLRAGT